ncbi:unnamed protein product [Musa hybrid cultivar]
MDYSHSLPWFLPQQRCSQGFRLQLGTTAIAFPSLYLSLSETSLLNHLQLEHKAMGCCTPRTSSPTRRSNRREDLLLQIPGASVYLMEDGGDAPVELAKGDFTVLRITEDDMVLATVVRVGADLRWPLTKDEPVIKLDLLHYLFTLPCKDGGFLNYGVSFAAPHGGLASLEMFLKENACFSAPSDASSSLKRNSSYEVYWKDYTPRIEDYNGVLAKAIAGGTGEIVKGIFKCSNAYTSQVQKGATLLQPQDAASNTNASAGRNKSDNRSESMKKRGEINKAIRRVRKLSEMTEKMSRTLLDGVVLVTSSVSVPLVRSKAGKSLLATIPGEVLLASLDAINKVLDAVEAAERSTLAATSNVVSGAVSKRFGESAGEATDDVFATAGHAIGTAWNLFKIRKAISPSSSLQSSILKTAVRKK